MASRWILNKNVNTSLLLVLGLFISCSVLISSCGTIERTTNKSGEESNSPSETTNNAEAGVSEAFISILNSNRSKLNDVYTSSQNQMPDVFLENSTARNIGDPNQGYRVQILSTRNVSQADSMANDFRFWAETRFNSYVPKAYVLYRQPYYKVHIGDFQFQDEAMKLNKIIKSRYTEAWVVPDEIEPDLVPTDTLSFKQNKESNL